MAAHTLAVSWIHGQPGRYGPSKVISASREQMIELTDIPLSAICTLNLERDNLNMRKFVKRHTWLTSALSKIPNNLISAAGLYPAFHSFFRVPWELDALLSIAPNRVVRMGPRGENFCYALNPRLTMD